MNNAAQQLKTIENLEQAFYQDEHLELVNGEIIKRPMARAKHGVVQRNISAECTPYVRTQGPHGWWFMTEIGVCYNQHQTPCHDVAGWRKERLPKIPDGVVQLPPDWVCEIISPGHEKKDTLYNFLLLQKYAVPYYWIIWPEDEILIAYKLINNKYMILHTIENAGKVRIEPFADIEFDLDYVFGK